MDIHGRGVSFSWIRGRCQRAFRQIYMSHSSGGVKKTYARELSDGWIPPSSTYVNISAPESPLEYCSSCSPRLQPLVWLLVGHRVSKVNSWSRGTCEIMRILCSVCVHAHSVQFVKARTPRPCTYILRQVTWG